ncbi:MAG: enoyl-CoA hydratase/isomerase family protein [Pseudorhodoplanes sp.]
MSNILIDNDGATRILTFNRANKRNALSLDLRNELAQGLRDAYAEAGVRSVVISGGNALFSTGNDMNETVKLTSAADYHAYNALWREITHLIEQGDKPVIAAIEGYCMTGGLELALACDMRIAGKGATFGMTSAKVGSVAGTGGTQRLPRLIGKANALDMILTARFVEAEEAFRMGLVNRVVETGSALKSACEIGKTLSAMAPLALKWSKEAIHRGLDTDLDTGLELEAGFTILAASTQDRKEGMTAFLEKRAAVFRGA